VGAGVRQRKYGKYEARVSAQDPLTRIYTERKQMLLIKKCKNLRPLPGGFFLGDFVF
jgi:hypothetical protein